MNKRILLVVLIIGFICEGVAQDKKNKISVNLPQLFVFNITNIEYERSFNEGKLGIAFFYGRTGNTTIEINNKQVYFVEQNVSVKRYLKSFSERSFWYGGQLSVASADVFSSDDSGETLNQGTLGVFGTLGYQFIIKSFYVDAFAGLGYALTNDLFGNVSYSGNESDTKLLGTFGLKMGVAF